MKKCPFCAAEIQDEAIKCRFCREFLENNTAPSSTGTSAERRVLQAQPQMPDVIKAGLALYIISSVLGLASGFFVESPDWSEGDLINYACLALLLIPADIVGLIMACLGRAWGAILMTCISVVSWILTIPLVSLGFGLDPTSVLSSLLTIASLVCFLVPNAWAYYRKSESYRKSMK